MTHYLFLKTRDPVVARDGRPFGADQGRHMHCLDWPTPATLAGALRTALGRQQPDGFTPTVLDALKGIRVAGPFPYNGETLFLPAPGDLVRDEHGRSISLRPQPLRPGEDTNLPHGLRPVMLPGEVEADYKYGDIPAWWSVEKLAGWLATAGPPGEDFFENQTLFRKSPARDERTHVEIEPNTLAAKEGLLFSTRGLVLDSLEGPGDQPEEISLAVRVENAGPFASTLENLEGFQPLGGERRLVRWRKTDTSSSGKIWQCPDSVRAALAKTKRVRLVLASPAVFQGGWRPGWVEEGSPPGGLVGLKLVGVCNQRWRAVSGWSLEEGRSGPKPIRRIVPSGGVYFFEVTRGDPATLGDLWLQPVSDRVADANEGFGLALWGVW